MTNTLEVTMTTPKKKTDSQIYKEYKQGLAKNITSEATGENRSTRRKHDKQKNKKLTPARIVTRAYKQYLVHEERVAAAKQLQEEQINNIMPTVDLVS